MKTTKLKIMVVGLLILGLILGIGLDRIFQYLSNQSSYQQGDAIQMEFVNPTKTISDEKRVFINASANADGNTSTMARDLFGDLSYEQINLVDYDIPQFGQGEGDFDTVYNQIIGADIIVIGTPVYWSNMSGYLKTFIDHMEVKDDLQGADLYVIVQGTDSDQTLAIQSTYGTLNRIAVRFELNFVGLASNDSEITNLQQKMQRQ